MDEKGEQGEQVRPPQDHDRPITYRPHPSKQMQDSSPPLPVQWADLTAADYAAMCRQAATRNAVARQLRDIVRGVCLPLDADEERPD